MKNLSILKNTVTRTFHKVGFQLKKHSPEILVVAGVVGTVASAVMACKATTKVSGILDDAKTQIDQVKTVLADESVPAEKYSEEDSKKDIAIIYANTGVKLAKLYGPSVLLGVLSVISMLASNNILRKRNVALAAAYTAVDRGFKEYRGRVIERFGEELDKELKYNLKAREVEEVVVDENGKETTVKKTIHTTDIDPSDPNSYSQYARFYDDGCTGWEKDSEHNLFFLKCQQNYANELLRSRGYLFLNEVYDMIGVPRSKAGQVVGWRYDEKNPSGDNYVDFGIFDIHNEKSRDFVNGYERTILLDFNVDGEILHYMK